MAQTGLATAISRVVVAETGVRLEEGPEDTTDPAHAAAAVEARPVSDLVAEEEVVAAAAVVAAADGDRRSFRRRE